MNRVNRELLSSSDLAPGMRAWIAEERGMAIAFYRIEKGFDARPHYKGLPHDMCPCSHWGYIIRGRLLMRAAAGEEMVLEAGDAYSMSPGHVGEALEEVEMIEFTPAEEYRRKNDHVRRVLENRGGS